MCGDRKDLEAFLSRRDICDHLRGEFPDPADAQRSQEVVEGTRTYCKDTDAELKALKVRYAKDAAAMEILHSLEEGIE
jgi:hypothetical protein